MRHTFTYFVFRDTTILTVNMEEMVGTEVYDYIGQTKGSHLTIGDVRALKIGDKLDVVVWDRNWEETGIAWNTAIPGKIYKATEFFKDNRMTLVYKGNMVWDIVFPFGETIEHPVHLDVSRYSPDWNWAPIWQGCEVRIGWCKNCSHVDGLKDCTRVKLTDVPDTVRVGWRGPIMLWSKVNGYVYMNEEELSSD